MKYSLIQLVPYMFYSLNYIWYIYSFLYILPNYRFPEQVPKFYLCNNHLHSYNIVQYQDYYIDYIYYCIYNTIYLLNPLCNHLDNLSYIHLIFLNFNQICLIPNTLAIDTINNLALLGHCITGTFHILINYIM